jgi:hypothetical protein
MGMTCRSGMNKLCDTIGSRFPLAALVLLALSGCRHSDVNRELVERELRLQEDEIYHLHGEVSERETRLAATRRENEILKRELIEARSPGGTPSPRVDIPPAPDALPPRRSRSQPPGADASPPVIEVPGLEGPTPGEMNENITPPPARRNGAWKSMRGVRGASFQGEGERERRRDEAVRPASAEIEAPGGGSRDERVAKVVLNRRLTGGFNADRRLGDEGVMVVLEPRNEADELVRRAGRIAVAVIDPQLSGEESHVARWEFESHEAMQSFRKTALGEGYHLDLRWPNRPPAHERLMLVAQFTSPEGKKFEVSQAIVVDLAASDRND